MSCANDNTTFLIEDDISCVIASLEKASKAFFEWFENYFLKSDADRYHLLLTYNNAVSIRVSEYDIKNSECEKLLGVNKLTLKNISLISVEKLVEKSMH